MSTDKVGFIYQEEKHFKGLNTLRFLAAFLVVLHHSESMKLKNDLPYLGEISLFHNGTLAVNFFFVLSGFLITYFLLKEKRKTSSINIKHFYLKRVLRIFPLYFLLVIFGTLVVPFLIDHLNINYDIPYTFGESWYFYVFFVPCLVTFYYGHHLLEPLWSIGVEMFFYVIWPPLMKYLKVSLLVILLSVIIIRIGLLLMVDCIDMPAVISYLIKIYSIEAMAIGGLGAYFVFFSKKEISSCYIFKAGFQYFFVFLFLVYLFFNKNIDNTIWNFIFKTQIFSNLILQFIFLYIIISFSFCQTNLCNKENKTLSYFGEISYGIYMYHTSVIAVAIMLFQKFEISNNIFVFNFIYYAFIIGSTLLIAHLSKKYFEDYFLKLMKKK